MVAIDLNLLGALLGAITDRLTNLYPEIGLAYQVYWATGCRRDEALDYTRWAYNGVDTITLTPLKGNSERSFLASALPTNFANHIIAGTNPFPTVRSGKIDYMFKQYIYQTLWLTDKRLQSHAFRHMYCKRLYALGYTYDQIRIELGETNLSVAQGYVNSLIQVDNGTFKAMQWQTTSNSLFTFGSASKISSIGNMIVLRYYGDENYLPANILSNGDSLSLPLYSYSPIYSTGNTKVVSIYVNQVGSLDVIDVQGLNAYLPALDVLSNFPILTTLKLWYSRYTNISGLLSVQVNIRIIDFYASFDMTAPVSIRDFPSNLFSVDTLEILIFECFTGSNPSVSWRSAISVCINLQILETSKEDFTNNPISYTNFINCTLIRHYYASFPSDTLPISIGSCSSLVQLNIEYSDIVEWNSFDDNAVLEYFYFTNCSLLTTIFPTTLVNCPNMAFFQFNNCFTSTLRVDSIIESIFDFLVLNADITGVVSDFRNCTCYLQGTNSIPSGTYTAPAGFVLNVSNGTPANAQEFRYCVQENYGWTMYVN